ncbi:MAG: sialate O-acetylesterase [Bacteroidota bacterium]
MNSILFKVLFMIGILLFNLGCKEERSDWEIPSDKNDFHIFILMGQSNMSGYGTLIDSDTISVPHILKIPTIFEGEIQWEPAAHPLHNRLDSDRFGLGLPFAKKYLETHKGVTVGLIPLAFGGAGIDGLKKGSKVYKDFLIKAAFAKKHGVVKGVLWHQGESDTVVDELADSYEKKLHQLIADVRASIGNPELPFIVGNLAEFYGTGKDHNKPDRVKRINRVKQALRDVPKNIEFTGFVESTGCTSIDHHNVHFDRESYIILGHRYFDVYSTIISNNVNFDKE